MAAAMVAVPMTASAFDPLSWYREAFLGLWEGVDPLDGSVAQVSITDVERDGILEISQRESYFTFCANLGSDYSLGRGVITGAATVISKWELEVTSDFTCINDMGVPDSPPTGDDQVDIYTLKAHGRILALPEFDTSPSILLHRIAR